MAGQRSHHPDRVGRNSRPAKESDDRPDFSRAASRPGPGVRGDPSLRREGPGGQLPADQAAAAASRCPQRPRHPPRRCGLRGLQRLRRPVQHSGRRAAGRRRPQVQPLPHDGPVCPDPRSPARRTQPPHARHGSHHRAGHLRTRLQHGPTQHVRAPGPDPPSQRLLDRPVREVPRGPRLADQPDGAVRRLAHGRRRLRVLLRVHRWGDQPVLPGDLRRHDGRGAGQDARGGLPLHGGHDRQGDRVGPPAEVTDAGQAVLHVLRTRRHPRPAPRADRVVGQVPGTLRRRLGRAARGDPRPAEGAGPGARRHRADATARGDPRLGGHARGAQAGAGPADGGLRRLPRAHRPPRRAAGGRTRGPRRPGRHAGLLHPRRQRRLGRGHDQRVVQRDVHLQRCRWPRDARVRDGAHGRARHPDGVQPLRGGLGARDGHALPVDQAGRVPLGRHPQRHHRALAGWLHREGRDAGTVPPRHRRGAHRPRGRGPARADHGRRRRAAADGGREHGLLLRRRRSGRATRDAVLRDVLQPRHLPPGLDGGHPPQHPLGDGSAAASRGRRLGALRHQHRLEPGARPGRRACPTSWRSCRGCG